MCESDIGWMFDCFKKYNSNTSFNTSNTLVLKNNTLKIITRVNKKKLRNCVCCASIYI